MEHNFHSTAAPFAALALLDALGLFGFAGTFGFFTDGTTAPPSRADI